MYPKPWSLSAFSSPPPPPLPHKIDRSKKVRLGQGLDLKYLSYFGTPILCDQRAVFRSFYQLRFYKFILTAPAPAPSKKARLSNTWSHKKGHMIQPCIFCLISNLFIYFEKSRWDQKRKNVNLFFEKWWNQNFKTSEKFLVPFVNILKYLLKIFNLSWKLIFNKYYTFLNSS